MFMGVIAKERRSRSRHLHPRSGYGLGSHRCPLLAPFLPRARPLTEPISLRSTVLQRPYLPTYGVASLSAWDESSPALQTLRRCSFAPCNKPSLDAFIGDSAGDEGRISALCARCKLGYCAA